MRIAGYFLAAACAAVALAGSPGTQVWEKPIAPGLTYRMEVDSGRKRVIQAVRVSLGSPVTHAVTALAGGTVFEAGKYHGRARVSDMVSSADAIAGINGDFFPYGATPTGDPLGLMVRNGELLSTPYKDRASFAWGPGGSAVGPTTFEGFAIPEGGTAIAISGVNQQCGSDEVVLETPACGLVSYPPQSVVVKLRTREPMWGPRAAVTATVESVGAEQAEAAVPPNGAVLVARGTRRQDLSGLASGRRIAVHLRVDGFDWEKYDNVIGGGPMLVRGGKISIDGAKEGFGASFTENKHPRSAIGRTANGDLWLVEVDGRQETGDGLTLPDLAELMIRYGCVDAMNLDGGGSSTLNVRGLTVNRPSDGKERCVANGILIMGPHDQPYDGEMKIEGPKSLLMGSTAQLRVLRADGTTAPNSEVVWNAAGAAWIDQGGMLHPLAPGPVQVGAALYGRKLTSTVSVTGSG